MTARILEGPTAIPTVRDKSLGHFIFNRCSEYSERVFQIDGTTDESETYGSVKKRSIGLAVALQRKNIGPGDVVAVCSRNTLDNVIPLIAGLFVGATVANFDPVLSTRHTKHLLGLVTPRILFVEEESVRLMEESDADTEIVVLGSSSKYECFRDLCQEGEEEFRPADVDPESVALMFFSSGTTGLPKAICHTHRNYFPIVEQACYTGWEEGVFHFSTFYWMTAVMIFLGCCNRGSYRVFCRNMEAEEILRVIQTHNVKSVFMAPTLTYKLTRCESLHLYDTSSLKVVTVGGTPITSSQIEKLKIVFPKAVISVVYGMTEIGVISVFPSNDAEIARKKTSSSGKPIPNMKIKVVDPLTGEPLPPNRKGEICARAATLMKGYYKTDSSGVLDRDGFLMTGDEGYYDEDGCVYVVERIKEMFRHKYWHVIPSSVEAVLLEHPGIKEAVVFGIPDEEDGDVPGACVVLKSGCSLDEEEIDRFLSDRVADTERLRAGVTFVESLPHTPTGKVVRRQIRDFVMGLKK